MVPLNAPFPVPVFRLTQRVVTLGRGKGNDLDLSHRSASRHHARIRLVAGAYLIEDNQSLHGVEVNGKKVRAQRLRHNDEIRIGDYLFRFLDAPIQTPTLFSPPPHEIDRRHLLFDVTRLINSSLALEEVLARVIDSVLEVTRAERGFLMLMNKAGELEFRVARNFDRTALEAEQVALSHSTVESVRETGAPVVMTDIKQSNTSRPSDSIVELHLRSIMCVPLKVQERLIGVIYVDSHRRVTGFSQTDRWLLESLASQAAVALEKSQLYEQLQQYNVTLEDQVQARTADLARANAELRQAYAELRAAETQIIQAEKLAALGRLAAGIAHEVNSPLGVMASSLDTVGRALNRLEERLRELPEFAALDRQIGISRQLRALHDVYACSRTASTRLHSIIKALENFVGLDQAERKPVNANEALDATLTLLEHLLGDRIRIIKEYGELSPLTCAPGRIHQMLMNVLRNAIEAIDAEGEIRVKTEQSGDVLRVVIADTGRGMTSEQLRHALDPILTQKEGRIGAGLGLALTRQVVQEHHGEITIESEPGVGTCVTIIFSLCATPAA